MASTAFPTRALTAALFTLLAWAATPFTTQAQLPDYLPTDGLVGWWPFNGNANDESGNGNDGVVNGAAPTEDRFGNANSAYYFVDNNIIDFGLSNDFAITSNVISSVSLWFYSASGKHPFLNKYEDSEAGNSNFFIGGDDGIHVTANGQNSIFYPISPAGWFHVVAVYDGTNGTVQLYINAQSVATGSLNYNNLVSTNPLVIQGTRMNNGYDDADGKIDDIAIYNRALTPEEITALYTGIPYVAPCADPTACNFEQEGECVFAEPNLDCAGNCLNDFNNNGVCDEVEVYGCTYSSACNYNPDATSDDGTCTAALPNYDCAGNCLLDLNNNGLCDLEEAAGCTKVDAINYNADATLDDGSCMVTCKGDFDNDGQITINDLLGFLAAFGNQCEGAGCMDPAGCNYDPNATFDLGYCEYPAEFFNCDGTPINDTDGDGIPDELEVAGCTDPEAGNYNPDATDDDGSCTPAQPQYPAGSVFCNGTPTLVVEVLNPETGRIWMDRNLGASQAATSSTDEAAYGDLYQWGRGSDGHQCRNSATTITLSSSDQPAHGDFITTSSSPVDWRSPQNNDLWQGVNGVNNPCPSGYRLPTETEWNAERLIWSSNDATGATTSPLKLPLAGYRRAQGGALTIVNAGGIYWSTSVSGISCRYLFFNNDNAEMSNNLRAEGYSLRCIKD